ncbi:MAG: AAA family ATPase [Clostridia bacterium]|nr:AAA family ATPase [Clostridia bacterium]
MNIKIRSSNDTFRKLRENEGYYIDKTDMIEEYLERRFEDAILFARPRRFGKSLTMTMFRDFLDIRQDSKKLFEGLNIMKYPDVVKKYMNQYPVIFLSLKEVFGNDFDSIYDNYCLSIANLCKSFEDLLFSERIKEPDKAIFKKIEFQEANQANTVAALDLLTRMLYDHYQKPVFVIIDEYDVPMAKAYGSSAYDKVRDMIELMLSYVCKTNGNVKGVILSGCLYTVKNSTYTGVNNIIPYTILSPLYAGSIGFTDEDVKKLLEDAGLSELYETVEEWYDGYIFGRERMYCPWDVLSFVKSKLDGSYSEAMGPESYWTSTSETSQNLIHGFFGKTADANERFERLLAGNTIECTVNEFVPYHRIHESGENLWSALLETGYLTKTVKEKMPLMPLKIPNRSIQIVFRQEVWNYFNDKVDNAFVRDLINGLWAGEIERAESSLNQILEATLSFYHEYHEYSYHLILDGFFTGLGYLVQSERETGYGRSDLIILDPARQRCMILEIKHVKTEDEMESALREAVSQTVKGKYESQVIYEGYTTRIQYGMAFWDKHSLIKRVGIK